MNDSIPVSSALDEETARAEVYGLLATLFYAPPAPELLAVRVAHVDGRADAVRSCTGAHLLDLTQGSGGASPGQPLVLPANAGMIPA